MNIENYTITKIHRGRNERRHIIYAELRDEKGKLVAAATLDYICNRIRELTKELPQPSPEDGCSASNVAALRNRIADMENGLRQIAIWNQKDQDDHDVCALQWRGCVAIARELLKPHKELTKE